MNILRQVIAVTGLSLRTLHLRFKASLVVVLGLACVVTVTFSILALGNSIRIAFLASGDPNRAIVLSLGAQREAGSFLSRAAVAAIMDAAHIRLADAEVFVQLNHLPKKNGGFGYTGLRGIGATGFALRPEFKLVAGRMPQPGRREVIVGVLARDKFVAMDVGGTVPLADGAWPIVGVFSTGNFLDGDMITDAEILMAAQRRSQYSSVLLRLERPDDFAAFKTAVTANPALHITVERESEYWQRFWDSLPKTPLVTAALLAFLLGSGAVAGTLQTMYGAVSSRENEIAVLRALGFDGFAVAVSVVLEAMLLAAIGAAFGIGIDWLWLNGYVYNGAYGVFRVVVTFELLLAAIGFSLPVALVGSVAPAIRASRVTVVDALRGG